MAARFFIRQAGGAVQGPFDGARIRKWAAEGKVRPEMEFSEDQETWWRGSDWPDMFAPAVQPVASPPSPRSAPPLPPPLPHAVACPYCSGEVKPAAAKCKHCGEWLAADERVGPARGRASGYGPGRTRAGGRRRTQASQAGPQRSSKKKWLLIGVGVFVFMGIVGQALDKGAKSSRSRSGRSSDTFRFSTFKGQKTAILEKNFTAMTAPPIPGRTDPMLGVEPAFVGTSSTLASLVGRVRGSSFIRKREGGYVCFQWNAKLRSDEFGADRGHRPAFWIILSADTIRRIQNPRAVDQVGWLGHFIESGRGRWR